MNNHIDPLQCIIPPHMLKNIAEKGSDAQKRAALASLSASARIREQRTAFIRAMVIKVPAAIGVKHRSVYTANNGTYLPGVLMRDEGAPPSADVAVNEAYDGSGATYDLYMDIYQRNSLDGNGLRLNSTVHYDKNYDNAFWNGQQMVYGDGDGQLFNRFTISIDVIGHELTHGVTQYTSNLDYNNQPGALNESFSDIFGSLVKQRKLGQTADQADWLIGAELLTMNVRGVALRSMKAPGTAYNDPVLGKDPQPAHMKDYVTTLEDNGGVHINSGIPNHAFYVMAVEMGGFAWEKAGRIWYVAARDKFNSGTNFQSAANLTHQAAGELYGAGSLEQMAVAKGWSEVGITVGAQPEPQPQPQPNGCLAASIAALRALFGGK